MAGLIKGQILKHLSRFVVNLSPSQISLSALRGEGELTGLELNCAVLSDLLELPAWVRLTQVCACACPFFLITLLIVTHK